jgi:hypothetical protein
MELLCDSCFLLFLIIGYNLRITSELFHVSIYMLFIRLQAIKPFWFSKFHCKFCKKCSTKYP